MQKMKSILLQALLVLYFPVMLGLVNHHQQEVPVGDVAVEVMDSSQTRFVSDEEIRKAILGRFDGALGEPVNTLNLQNIEAFVEKHSAVKNCEVYNTVNGSLKVDLIQHLPLLRVFENDRTYYIDEQGNEMPTFDHYTSRVLIVSGHIAGEMEHLIYLARYFRENPSWRAQFEQMFIKKNGDYVLVPRVGDHLILFGPPERIHEKLRNLKALYQKGLDQQEWNRYQVINLKYKGQVLCSKNRNI